MPARSEKPTEARPFPWIWIVLTALVVGLILLFLLPLLRSHPPPENLLMITLDTTRADHLGCYGARNVDTPNLDRLARSGALFLRCSSASPLTLPSHATIMTGTFPPVHGARRNGESRVRDSAVTLAERLREEGFRTGAVLASFVLHRKFGLDQGFQEYLDVAAKVEDSPLQAERRGRDVCEDAIRLLEELSAEPFFLWVHFYDPHYPYLSLQGRSRDSPEAYREEIEYTDEQVGRLLGELRRRDLEDETLIAVVGDHGEALKDHGELTHGYFLYESTLRVPWILSAPGTVPAGLRSREPVSTVDVAPTLLELLGRTPLSAAAGRSLAPMIREQDAPGSSEGYAESVAAHVHYGLSMLRSLTRDGWKYIHAPSPELYDLTRDPEESENVLEDHPQRAAELKSRLRELVDGFRDLELEDVDLELSEEDRARLEALGYLADGPADEASQDPDIDRFELVGANPMEYARFLETEARARWAWDDGDLEEAETLFQLLVEEMPGSRLLHLNLIRVVRDRGDLERARSLLETHLERWPEHFQGHVAYIRLLARLRDWPRVIRQAELLLVQDAENTPALYELGMALAYTNRWDEAGQRFQQGLAVEPENVRLLNALGNVRARQGRLEEAGRLYRQALEVDPDCRICRQGLERINRRMREAG